ncbi:uncharacterized protein LOC105439975 [Strongylocentrotus purpuratus]|uniref:Uncharacterized protein n=1 Tax=Strongylocentrotus purpuratus TaxID=7668 RepID=A0A7M7NYI4_STRPU|nr:uncharacterized protein LOC105439975 [Strongylocentrotus purpuratus]
MPDTLRVTTISSSPHEGPSSSLPTSSEVLDLITSTPCQIFHPIPTGLTSTETGSDRGIQIDVVFCICIILAVVVILLLPANVLFLRSRMRKRKAPPPRLEDNVENDYANKEILLVKIEDIHNPQNAA